MAKKATIKKDLSTEEKIRTAARAVFTEKGFAGARTRDIAEAAGINLALLNYYFRSKRKLFEEILLENITQLFGHILPIAMAEETSLEEKVEAIVDQYIEKLKEIPGLPMFVLSEISNGSFTIRFPIAQILQESVLIRQVRERNPRVDPLHYIINVLGMTIFPFMAQPVFRQIGLLDQKHFDTLISERKKLIPAWNILLLDN